MYNIKHYGKITACISWYKYITVILTLTPALLTERCFMFQNMHEKYE